MEKSVIIEFGGFQKHFVQFLNIIHLQSKILVDSLFKNCVLQPDEMEGAFQKRNLELFFFILTSE